MSIIIKLLDKFYLEDLFVFELENRSFFNKIGLSRGDNYYNYNTFQEIINELIEEQEKDLLYMYLIINDCGKIIGRVNLVSIVREGLNKAELGYRIGEKHQRKGQATKAVSLVLDIAARVHKLKKIEAATSPDNIGSQQVLIKNGFQMNNLGKKYVNQGVKISNSISFEKILV